MRTLNDKSHAHMEERLRQSSGARGLVKSGTRAQLLHLVRLCRLLLCHVTPVQSTRCPKTVCLPLLTRTTSDGRRRPAPLLWIWSMDMVGLNR